MHLYIPLCSFTANRAQQFQKCVLVVNVAIVHEGTGSEFQQKLPLDWLEFLLLQTQMVPCC